MRRYGDCPVDGGGEGFPATRGRDLAAELHRRTEASRTPHGIGSRPGTERDAMTVEWGHHHARSVSHAWRFLDNGRRASVCGLIPERWTSPLPEVPERSWRCWICCARLDRETQALTRKDDAAAVLGNSWPAALSKMRIAYRARISPKAIDVVLEELVAEGLVTVTETDAGNPRYFARRALVEASGRTYGMGS